MRLLVTGGDGFIGSNFIHYWFRKHPKDSVVNVDKLTYAANPENLNGVEKYEYEFIKADITDSTRIGSVVKDVDCIVNFAAESHVDNSIADSSVFVRTNVLGVHVLLEAAKKYEKRFHQVSTDEVYGALPLNSKVKFNENSPYRPRNPYSATKAAADHLVMAYCNTYKLNATISNSSNNFGPRQHQEKLIPKTVYNALHNKEVPVYGNGLQIRDWIYVDDHCSAIEVIIKKGSAGETYLVGANQELHNIDLVKKLLGHLRKPESLIKFIPDRPGHDARYAIDARKIMRDLGWKPKGRFESRLKQTVDWYRKFA